MLCLKKLSLLYILTVDVFCEENSFKPRIVGGEECDYLNYPYAVAIFHNFFCGGSLLTLQWVLTAAHCINIENIADGQTYLRTGFHYHTVFVQVRKAAKGIAHEKFRYSRLTAFPHPELRYDIGLIWAQSPFQRSELLQPAKLPHSGFTKNCKVATAIGIGFDRPMLRSNYNRTLMCVDLPIISNEECLDTWEGSVVDESILCTSEKKGGKDACKGDSGGPLICEGVVIGITSLGKGCALPYSAATFTRVENYLGFIKEVMAKSDSVTGGKLCWTTTAVALIAEIYSYHFYLM